MLRKVFIFLIIAAFLSLPALAKSSLKIGTPPPPLSLPDLNGKTIELEDYLGKKIIVLSFFASWSKSCREEILFLNELDRKYSAKGVKVIGVSFDRKLKGLESFISENQIRFEVLHDQKLRTLKDFRILIIPTLFVIDGDGNLTNIYVDYDQNVEKALLQEIAELVNPPKQK